VPRQASLRVHLLPRYRLHLLLRSVPNRSAAKLSSELATRTLRRPKGTLRSLSRTVAVCRRPWAKENPNSAKRTARDSRRPDYIIANRRKTVCLRVLWSCHCIQVFSIVCFCDALIMPFRRAAARRSPRGAARRTEARGCSALSAHGTRCKDHPAAAAQPVRVHDLHSGKHLFVSSPKSVRNALLTFAEHSAQRAHLELPTVLRSVPLPLH
jgi:hypothetical protein